MHRKTLDAPRDRAVVLAAAVLAVCGLLVGFLADLPTTEVREVLAACGYNPGSCPGLDTTRTSVLTVNHAEDPESTNNAVEPDDTDSWEITVVWATGPYGLYPSCNCQEVSSTIDVDVTWTGSNWSATCTGCNSSAGPIWDVDVCAAGSSCAGAQNHSAAYKLILDIDTLNLFYCAAGGGKWYNAWLQRVEYETTDVDDGHIVDLQACTEGSSVSPISQTCSLRTTPRSSATSTVIRTEPRSLSSTSRRVGRCDAP